MSKTITFYEKYNWDVEARYGRIEDDIEWVVKQLTKNVSDEVFLMIKDLPLNNAQSEMRKMLK